MWLFLWYAYECAHSHMKQHRCQRRRCKKLSLSSPPLSLWSQRHHQTWWTAKRGVCVCVCAHIYMCMFSVCICGSLVLLVLLFYAFGCHKTDKRIEMCLWPHFLRSNPKQTNRGTTVTSFSSAAFSWAHQSPTRCLTSMPPHQHRNTAPTP